MKVRWLSMLLAVALLLPACSRTENKPDVDEDELELDVDTGENMDASELDSTDDADDESATDAEESSEAAPAP